MFRNNDDHFDDDHGLVLGVDVNPAGKNQRHEPKFGGFDDDDEHDYEDSDRDTDHASGYHADEPEEEEEEEEVDDTSLDEDEDEEERDLFPELSILERYESARSESEEIEEAEAPDAWLEKEGYLEEEEEDGQRWPLSLIAVGLVALVLLIAGGYGVMQQRAATQEELTQLRATLATSGNVEEMRTTREALQELKASYDKLAANAEALTLENRRLTDTVAGLEAQLGVQQSVLTKTSPAAKQEQPAAANVVPATSQAPAQPVVSAPVSAPVASGSATAQSPTAQPPTTKPAAQTPAAENPTVAQTAAASTSGPWFVNFGSYAARSMAESWAARLHPRAGKVIIAPNAVDGKTLYRLRVVGLASKSAADEVARTLQAELQVSQLWVGRE